MKNLASWFFESKFSVADCLVGIATIATAAKVGFWWGLVFAALVPGLIVLAKAKSGVTGE
mgnify:CR=1 FL=1